MSYQDNFFTNELYQYYLEKEENLSEQVIQILNKSPLDLTDEERETYQKTILPTRQNIKQTLEKRLGATEETRNEWEEQLHIFSQSIIGQIAAEVFLEITKPSAPSGSTTVDMPSSKEEMATIGQESPPPTNNGAIRSRKKHLIILGGISLATICAVLLVVFLWVIPALEKKVDIETGEITVCKCCDSIIKDETETLTVKESKTSEYPEVKTIQALCDSCHKKGQECIETMNVIYARVVEIDKYFNDRVGSLYMTLEGVRVFSDEFQALYNNELSKYSEQVIAMQIPFPSFSEMKKALQGYVDCMSIFWAEIAVHVTGVVTGHLPSGYNPTAVDSKKVMEEQADKYERERNALIRDGFASY